jgi:hypothetical protein
MAFLLRSVRFQTADPLGTAGRVSFFAGEDEDPEKSNEWLSGQVISDTPNQKSLALHQIAVLYRVRALIDAEIERLKPLYEQSQQAR